ncbi:hypothetical protein KM043_000077, partial [Ampulex compressa]
METDDKRCHSFYGTSSSTLVSESDLPDLPGNALKGNNRAARFGRREIGASVAQSFRLCPLVASPGGRLARGGG